MTGRGEEAGSEDSEARSLWSLGMAVRLGPSPDVREAAEELLERIYEQIRRVMYAENMYIALYHPATDEIEFVFSRNVNEIQPGARYSAQVGITGHILRSHQPVFIHGNAGQVERELGVLNIGTPVEAFLGVPLLLGERALGVIAVQHHTDPNAYDDTHLMLLQAIAGQAAVALENAGLYVEADRRAGHRLCRRLREQVRRRRRDRRQGHRRHAA